MRSTVLFFVPMLLAQLAGAQFRSCRIVSARSGAGIPNVAVSGLQSDASWLSDSLGIVRMDGQDAGPFRFSHISYQTRILRPDTSAGYWLIVLQPLPYSLDGVEVLSPLARFRRDSAFNHSFFRRELADAKFKLDRKFVFVRTWRGMELQIELSGVFSNLAQLASGRKTQYRRLTRELKRIEARKFAAIRYTTALVGEQTGLAEDSAMAFIAAHPLDEEFLRSASELELKMRVRDMYRSKR